MQRLLWKEKRVLALSKSIFVLSLNVHVLSCNGPRTVTYYTESGFRAARYMVVYILSVSFFLEINEETKGGILSAVGRWVYIHNCHPTVRKTHNFFFECWITALLKIKSP